MNIKFLGYKKTKETFLDRLKKISNDMLCLKDNLYQLKIFTSLKEEKNKITVCESKNQISINSKGKDKNEININFPNLFGKGEIFNINIRSLKEYEVNLTKPFIVSNLLLFADFKSKRSLEKCLDNEFIKNTNEIGLRNKYLDLGYGLDKYLFLKINLPNFNFNVQQGMDFTKISSNINLQYSLFRNVEHHLILNTGCAIGKIKDYDKFYLGENIKGYKKNTILPFKDGKSGGRSFIEITNKLVVSTKNMCFYIFDSIGCNHADQNILNYKYKLDQRNPGSLGHSVGIGVNIPLYDQLKGPKIDISVGFPLIKELDVEPFQFSFDIKF